MKMARFSSTLIVVAALLLSFASSPASAGLFATVDLRSRNSSTITNFDKIDASLVQALSANGKFGDGTSVRPATADFYVWLDDQADLAPAARLATKTEKGRFVYTALHSIAERSQAPLLAYLDRQGIAYQSFYIANMILVRQGDLSLASTLASRTDVARITSNHVIQMPQPLLTSTGPASPAEVEPNITFINADDAWALGVTGQGVVLGAMDTGLQWDHPAIIEHYRGWNGVTADHNYNWWDATGQYPTEPADGNGHGTMVTGVMVGGQPTDNQIGVAPGAKTIHCKAFTDGGGGTEDDIVECFQWMIAPWDLSGGNANPALAPDALNNSWGSGTTDPLYEFYIDILQSAGILVEASAGGAGPGCASLGSPANFAQVLTTGGVNHTGGVLPGSLAPFSARGPSSHDPLAFIPDVMAPSVDIRSSFPPDTYQVWSGTAVAGAHVTGLVGLIWSANPSLRGNIIDTSQIIYDSAVPLTGQGGSNCGGDYITGPNNDWGYGTIDALAAVQQALLSVDSGILSGTVTDAQTDIPLEGVDIHAVGAQEWLTMTNSLGLYSMVVPSGTYTISAALAGYYTNVITSVTVISGELTTRNLALVPIPAAISGSATDAQTHASLVEATIQAVGEHGSAVTTTNEFGEYNLTMPGGTYTMTAELAGYNTELLGGVAVSNGEMITQDFALLHLPVMITGTVTDANTGLPLPAVIRIGSGPITATLADPETGIYTISLPAHSTQILTAQALGYGIVTQVVDVQTEDLQQDFVLPAGQLDIEPLGLNIELDSGQGLTVPITLTNTGGLSLTFTISPTAPWLTVSPDGGVLPVTGTQVLEVHIDSTGLLAPGVYTATIFVETDTPYGVLSLPVTVRLTVVRYELFLPVVVSPVGSGSKYIIPEIWMSAAAELPLTSKFHG